MSTQDKIERSVLVQRRLDLRAYLGRIKRKMKGLTTRETNVVSDIKRADQTLNQQIKILETKVT